MKHSWRASRHGTIEPSQSSTAGTIKTRLELALRKVRTAIVALGGAGEWAHAQA